MTSCESKGSPGLTWAVETITVSQSIGAPEALNIVLTASAISGPIPSPGIRVTVRTSLSLYKKITIKYTKRTNHKHLNKRNDLWRQMKIPFKNYLKLLRRSKKKQTRFGREENKRAERSIKKKTNNKIKIASIYYTL